MSENAEKWIAALRSGTYAQGRGLLRQDDCYCVWGVACDVSGLGTWKPVQPGFHTLEFKYDEFTGATGSPPEKVVDWVGKGFWYDFGVSGRLGKDYTLMDLNDGDSVEPVTFDQLADLIEAFLNGWNLKVGVF
jgi:hypothetical protein